MDNHAVPIGHSSLVVQLHKPPSALIKHALIAATETIEYAINIICNKMYISNNDLG